MASVYSAPRSLFHRLWYEPPPSLAVEFTADAVAAACWTPGTGRAERVSSEPLPEGALRPSPVRDNLVRADEVRRAVAAVLSRVSRRRGGNVALLLPDLAARVSVITFEQFPEKQDEVIPLIRWRLKKTVPFEIDEAALAYYRQGKTAQGEEVAVAVSPAFIARQYEAATEGAGYQPGFVSLSSLAALGLLDQERRSGGTMLVRSAGRLRAIVIVSRGGLRVFRSNELAPGEEGHGLEEVAADVYSSAVYFQDNYQEKVERIFLAGFGQQTSPLQEAVEREVGIRPQVLLVPGSRGQDEMFLGVYGMIAEQAKES